MNRATYLTEIYMGVSSYYAIILLWMGVALHSAIASYAGIILLMLNIVFLPFAIPTSINLFKRMSGIATIYFSFILLGYLWSYTGALMLFTLWGCFSMLGLPIEFLKKYKIDTSD